MSGTWEPANLEPFIKFLQAAVAEMCDPEYPLVEDADG
jgi:hypothetical protein